MRARDAGMVACVILLTTSYVVAAEGDGSWNPLDGIVDFFSRLFSGHGSVTGFVVAPCSTNGCESDGEKMCFGNYARTCGDYGGCLQWNLGQYCTNGCENGECQAGPLPDCTDSDGGITPEVRGYVIYNGYNVYDSCNSDSTTDLSEAYCSGDMLMWAGVRCSAGCSEGACLPGSQTCLMECNYEGQTQCSGSYMKTCGDYNDDSCLEWDSGGYCSNGCEHGECLPDSVTDNGPTGCGASQTLCSGVCYNNTQPCSIANGVGSQSGYCKLLPSGGVWMWYDACNPQSCNSGYLIEGDSCVPSADNIVTLCQDSDDGIDTQTAGSILWTDIETGVVTNSTDVCYDFTKVNGNDVGPAAYCAAGDECGIYEYYCVVINGRLINALILKPCPNGCSNGACLSSPSCTPSCSEMSCGSDGCGGNCGQCEEGYECDDGLCVEAEPEPECLVVDTEMDSSISGAADTCGRKISDTGAEPYVSCVSYEGDTEQCGVIESTCISGVKGEATFVACEYGCEGSACVSLEESTIIFEDKSAAGYMDEAVDIGPTIIYVTEESEKQNEGPDWGLMLAFIFGTALFVVLGFMFVKSRTKKKPVPEASPQQPGIGDIPWSDTG